MLEVNCCFWRQGPEWGTDPGAHPDPVVQVKLLEEQFSFMFPRVTDHTATLSVLAT